MVFLLRPCAGPALRGGDLRQHVRVVRDQPHARAVVQQRFGRQSEGSAVAGLEIAQVNLVVAVFIWVMIYPMMIQIDWHAVKDVGKKPQGLMLTLVVNWLIKPFTMTALGVLFLLISTQS